LADFGFYTEVIEQSPGFLVNLQRMSDASAAWDGSEPIRHVTADGRFVEQSRDSGDATP
jgi:hypothetical protein